MRRGQGIWASDAGLGLSGTNTHSAPTPDAACRERGGCPQDPGEHEAQRRVMAPQRRGQ